MSYPIRQGIRYVLGVSLLLHASSVRAQDEPPPPPPPDVVIVTPAPEPAPVPVLVVTEEPRTSMVTETDTRRINPLLIGGFVSFGVSYGASVVVAATSDRNADKRLFIPVVGPWLDLADRGSCDIDNSACDGETTSKVLLIIDGVFQGAGVLAIFGGVLYPGSSSHTRSTTISSSVRVIPVSYGAGAPGLAAYGRF